MSKTFILGPCSIENEELFVSTMKKLSSIMEGRDWYGKASFDKANRSSLKGGRGPGLNESIKIWQKAKEILPGIRLITDVHECWQVEKLAGVVDVIQIPAFLGRQTDLVIECARHFDKINIKKMQHLGPNNLLVSVDKVKSTNPDAEVWICDRGTNFGYDKLFVDYTIVEELKKGYDKVILDTTHSTQRSRAVHGVQGDRALAEKYFMTASVFGYDGVFAECHPCPEEATSDGDCQIYLDRVENLLKKFDAMQEASRE